MFTILCSCLYYRYKKSVRMKCILITYRRGLIRFFLFCAALMWLCIGSYEAKMLFTNTEYEINDFCSLWLLNYITFFIDMAASIITLVYLSGLKLCDDASNSMIMIMYFCEFVIGVIAIIYKKMINSDCSKFWENTVPEFLSFVEFHSLVPWFYLFVAIMYLVGKIVACKYPGLFLNTDSLLHQNQRTDTANNISHIVDHSV